MSINCTSVLESSSLLLLHAGDSGARSLHQKAALVLGPGATHVEEDGGIEQRQYQSFPPLASQLLQVLTSGKTLALSFGLLDACREQRENSLIPQARQRRRRSHRLSVVFHKHQKAPGFHQLCLPDSCPFAHSRSERFYIVVDQFEHFERRLGVFGKLVTCTCALGGKVHLVPFFLAGLHSVCVCGPSTSRRGDFCSLQRILALV
mmetsp:Transcript_8149/g.21592  ORF Transcript_8149/g.21592 Transcript_8149/m.21592 type:complete len:205 (+) Transcript_8149:454-1068(+)